MQVVTPYAFSHMELRRGGPCRDSWQKGPGAFRRVENGSNGLFYTTQEAVTPAPASVTSMPESVTNVMKSVTSSVPAVTKTRRAVTKGEKDRIIPNPQLLTA